ncbi:hypothetical protein ACOTHX_13405 [Achromobacter xylosoxidans]
MKNDAVASPFFGAYNARHINAEQVAKQFVPSEKFWELSAQRNSLLIGPRGSGKTHLLKMMQPKALAAWGGEDANLARSKIGYWGVFIPADINWKTQVENKARALSVEQQGQFSNAIFLSHFREAFVTCLLQLTRDRPTTDFGADSTSVELNREKEVGLCVALAEAWELQLRVPSLDGLKLALVEELVRVGALVSLEHLSPYMSRLTEMDVLSAAREIAEHFSSATGIYSAQWALCFDELEIAPKCIQESLFQYLRSTDQRFLFKLAISPSNDASTLLNKEATASAGNDYDAIPLWFVDQVERERFCSRLWEKLVANTSASTISPQALLQRSRFQFANEHSSFGRRRYSEESPWTKDFEYLDRIDKSFSEYLRLREIDPSSLEKVSRAKMDSVVRKIAPLVGFRSAYLTGGKGDSIGIPARRPLKGPPADVFSGWDAVCTATEGNPRWFSGIASKLILKWSQSTSGRALTREQQTQELVAAAKKFLAWINAIPLEDNKDRNSQLSLHEFISALGRYFEQEVLGRVFKADPVASFVVDESTPLEVQRLVLIALNIGAIVIVDDENVNFTAASPIGRRFRLVHLLAPHFNLPMRKGKNRQLSAILAKQMKTLDRLGAKPAGEAKSGGINQLGLFN